MSYIEETFKTIKQNYYIRLSRKEKDIFLDYARSKLNELGHCTEIITGGECFTFTKNLITKPKKVKYILMAHYDTPTQLPFIMSKTFSVFGFLGWPKIITYCALTLQLLLTLLILLIIITNIFHVFINIFYYFILAILVYLITFNFFKKNPKNANDNTSGVLTLLYTAYLIKDKVNLKDNVMLVFTDKEEIKLWGAKHICRYLESNIDIKNVEIINIDCVGNGDIPVIGYATKSENDLSKKMKQHLCSSDRNTIVRKMSSSDHKRFNKYNAIGISMMKKSKLFNNYYIPNLHTPKDDYINPSNIEWCGQQIVKYIESQLAEQNNITEEN